MLFKKRNDDDMENEVDAREEQEPKRNIWKVISVILIIIIIILLLLRSCGGPEPVIPPATEPIPQATVNPNAPDIDNNAGEYVPPEIATGSSGVAIPGWVSLTIPANTTENIVVDFFNPEANADKYYLTFELRLPDDSEQGYEVLYTSGLVEPNLHIQSITLNRALEKGTYDAVLHVQPYHMENKAPTNNADLKTQLIVG